MFQKTTLKTFAENFITWLKWRIDWLIWLETLENSRFINVMNVSELNKIKALTLINSQWMLVSVEIMSRN